MKPFLSSMFLLAFLASCAIYTPPRPTSGLPPGHGGVPPGLAKKGKVPPGLAKKGGVPPGLAKKMGPPPVAVVGTPRFEVIPGTGIYVMIGVEAEVFESRGWYYYHHQGDWYEGRDYRGPWNSIDYRDLPTALRRESPRRLKAKARGRGRRIY